MITHFNNSALAALKRQIKTFIDQNYTTTLSIMQPIITRYIPVSRGIEITGVFRTNDETTEGRPLYVTVLRQSDKLAVQDGYGFVVIKGNSPQLRDKWNVFLIDHNIMLGDFSFGTTLQVPNINSFIGAGAGVISAGKVVINTNTNYGFRLVINENWSMELRIWREGLESPENMNYTMPDGPITSGALTDGPLGFGGRQIQSPITGEFINLPQGTDLGIGVDNPSGYKWYIADIQVRRFSGGIPLQIFEFSARKLISANLQVKYYGHGKYTLNNIDHITNVDLWIARVNDSSLPPELQSFDSWEYLGSTNDNSKARLVTTLSASEYTISGKIFVAVTKNFKDIDPLINTETVSINTDYIEVTRAENLPILDRTAVDIWIDPINILQNEKQVLYLSENSETLDVNLNKPVFFYRKCN